LGRNKGSVKAEGDFTARFVENGEVSANNVRVHRAVMHSKITAKNNVVVKGGKGVIVGGKIMAQHLVEANLIGSSLATKTIIMIGLEPELREKLRSNSRELEDIEENLDKIKKSFALLKKIKESGKKLPKNKIEMFKKLEKTRDELKKRKKKLEKENEEINESLKVSEKSLLKVNDTIFPGVQILSSKDKMIIGNKIGQCAFTELNNELRQTTDKFD